MDISKNILIFGLCTFLLSLLFPSDPVFGQSDLVEITTMHFENTWLIEFTNISSASIESFRLWSGDGSSFQSFKTEPGWSILKTPEGVLILKSDTFLKENESIKIGIKANSPIDLSWRAVGKNSETQTDKIIHPYSDVLKSESSKPESTILSDSTFKIIPENLRLGSTIRVVGNNFTPDGSLDFFIGDRKLDSILTTSAGDFIYTSQVPIDSSRGVVHFFIKDRFGNEISQKRYLNEQIIHLPEPKFGINELPSEIIQGEEFSISGNSKPKIPITFKILDSVGTTSTEKTINADSSGDWLVTLSIPANSELDEYFLQVSDTKEIISEKLSVSFSEELQLVASESWYAIGEPLLFEGTGIPDESLRLFLVDSQGNDIQFVDMKVSSSGIIKIEFPTDESLSEGTYFLYAFQGMASEIIPIGLNEYPHKIFSSKLDKVNYDYDDIATLAIIGEPYEIINLSVYDSSENIKLKEKIILDWKNKKSHNIDLTDFPTDSYSLVLTRGSSSISEVFSVGFPNSSFPIESSLNKITYEPEEAITLFGTTSPNIVLDIFLIDPEKKVIKKIETFSDVSGKFFLDEFIVPLNAKNGEWTIRIDSGFRSEYAYFSVVTSEIFSVDSVDVQQSSLGTFVFIDGTSAAPSESILLNIENAQFQKWTVEAIATTTGDFSVLWLPPEDAKFGDYRIKAIDANSELAVYDFKILDISNP